MNHDYIAFTVRPVREERSASLDATGRLSVVVTTADRADFWTVYGRYLDPDGLFFEDALADCPTKAIANDVAAGLRLLHSNTLCN